VDVEAKEFTIPGLIEAVVQLMSDSSKAET
jgi:hypothetical protein